MIKPDDPRDLVIDLIPRSICAVQVAAVIADKGGIFAWGWNHSGNTGWGMCAERHAISRANTHRLRDSTVYIAGEWAKNGNVVEAKPCDECQRSIDNWKMSVVYRNKNGVWR